MADSRAQPLIALFLQTTAHDAWLSVSDYVRCLDQAGYWSRLGKHDPEERVKHVQEMLTSLRDPSGELLFEHVEVLAENRVTRLYKQRRLIRRGGWRRP